MIRVGFLSAVRHAESYFPTFLADPRTTVVGVAEESDAAEWIQSDSRRFAGQHGLPLMSVAELLAPGVCDLVVACSEPTRHAALAITALDAGIDVLIDKPVAVNVAEADRILAAQERSGAVACVVNRLRSPAVERLRGWIDAGHLGLPLHVDVEWFASGAHFSTSVERPELVTDPELSGGGELLNFLLYPVDYIRFLTGLEVVEVYAEAATLFQQPHRDAGVEDSAVVSLLLENGVTATVTLARAAAAPGHGPVSSSVRVLGSHGHAVADDDKPAIAVYRTDGLQTARPVSGASSVVAVTRYLDELIGALSAGGAPKYTLKDARASLAVTEACYCAIRDARPITLGEEGARGRRSEQ
ncbi:Gfo/Idh/MocA family oxidoreductase [Microbacterium capsulatum]|uniref:Gfo/Idh/MocA family oxidoreductase n=1 Tax=Microbacterium capsulatum TaxID=3041921 RepID=A0ABU0XDF5_9MICO|nr:Gfo/Idh/MocA family oxidoreductase [Microbacterium sp. ASV81]MDQ4213096.1 Gfo/Idh/MocA family oxidoreductase [Microbacterium sp. ASV81]